MRKPAWNSWIALPGLTAAVLASAATPAAAQLSAPVLTLGLGLASPTGTFSSGYREEGFNKSLGMMSALSVRVGHLPFRVRLDGTYDVHSANEKLKTSLQAAIAPGTEEHVQLLGANLDLLMLAPLASNRKPYVLAGVGAYRSSILVKVGSTKARSTEISLAWNAGAGVHIQFRETALSIEARLISAPSPTGLPRMTFVPIMVQLEVGGP